MEVLLFCAFLGCVAAVPPVWYPDGTCGMSKYPDAGENCTSGLGTCVNPGSSVQIVGGIVASQGEFPFLVTLRDSSDNNAHKCGGVIINQEWVLTSAYCTSIRFADDLTRIQVVVGAHSQTTPAPNEAIYDVAYILPHETHEFIAGTPNENDISMLQMATPIIMNEDVSPICAPDPEIDYSAGIEVDVIGWGDLDRNGNGDGVDEPRYAGMRTFSDSYCSNQYALFGDVITERMLCASDTGNHEDRDFCEGDYGGPMVTKDGSAFRLLGIASYEQRCANGYPGVFTDVADPNINTWVSSKMVNRTTTLEEM